MTTRLIAERLIHDLTPAERERQQVVEDLLPQVLAHAPEADARSEFPDALMKAFQESGLLGLVIPTEYGGMGGTLRDLAATTYTLGTVCGSTALAFFFHCSSSSRGLLPLGAIDAGLYDEADVPKIKDFAERVLNLMGTERKWIGNFASEAVKASDANVVIQTTATRTEGGWLLNGVKSFGCLTDTADYYLVTARRDDIDGMDSLSLFLVDRRKPGVKARTHWNGLGMRASGNHGIVLEDCFVPDDDALAIPGAFMTSTKVARGSWVGNQIAIGAIYAGIARGAYDYALDRVMTQTFADTGKPIASSPMHQVMIGHAEQELAQVHLWAQYQLLLETSEEEILPKQEVVKNWRLTKGSVCEGAFTVTQLALKMCGTSGALMDNQLGRAFRDASMGLLQAFPAERGQLEYARMVVDGHGTAGFNANIGKSEEK